MKAELEYRRGLFQGDSLSPLLFCLCLAPLSHALREMDGYRCGLLDEPITHQLFMDDLKVYAKGKKALGVVLDTVDRVSAAIGMKLGLRKCAVAHMARRQVTSEDYTLPGGEKIGALADGRVYKYLGIEQIFKPSLNTVKHRVMQTYLKRL